MFEDSLVESQGRIRTQSRWFAIGSLCAQGAVLIAFVLYPLYRPQALPKQSLERILVAPPTPRAPLPVEIHRAPVAATAPVLPTLESQMRAPRTIPVAVATTADSQSPSLVSSSGVPGGESQGIASALNMALAPPTVRLARPQPTGQPVTVSSGVATGLLLRPIQPNYPAIAKQARIQGTVVIEATISRSGAIENLRVIDGPMLLRQAAIDAVAVARYRPFLLNGEPVEVNTSIRVVFSLGE